jgi:hypothetical protein
MGAGGQRDTSSNSGTFASVGLVSDAHVPVVPARLENVLGAVRRPIVHDDDLEVPRNWLGDERVEHLSDSLLLVVHRDHDGQLEGSGVVQLLKYRLRLREETTLDDRIPGSGTGLVRLDIHYHRW